ncbi:NAD(P)H oxidoreductase (fragment) [Hyella patelloides LEGE 07179]|uniref:NAD(P)H oxidoreductase n=1 Tax=Hyella patelloides LEGE 07179 TaxID=945734 RepID=A0A563VS30_9CYAN
MSLNVLAIFAHPNNKQSFNAGLLESTKQACKEADAYLTINDLYEKNFQPVVAMMKI